ncbi:MAG: acyl-CoA dehydratase activase [Bacillota bacterium]|nr:acyl-CoA dehydratase activase [Bacillota bacterium]
MARQCYLGVDVGSVTTKVVLLSADAPADGSPWTVLGGVCLPTAGRPLEAIQEALRRALDQAAAISGAGEDAGGGADEDTVAETVESPQPVVRAVGTTGSGRVLAGTVLGADVVKNEITAHAVAALAFDPGVQTILEIGGQDSKLIILRHGVVVDFAMNTVCAAGTGSFLDRQAARLNLPVEQLGQLALQSRHPVRIAGRCAVFAESDMIHKQQVGHSVPDVVRGLCQALVRNYLNNVGKGKEILAPVIFQGGVAANQGIVEAFREALELDVLVPPNHGLMGALGAALLAGEAHASGAVSQTAFRGFEVADRKLEARGFECEGCTNRCEIIQLYVDGSLAGRWGGRCGRWETAAS